MPFITAGDPDVETSLRACWQKLPAAGADLIELGMPFSDPMADGPAIQASSLRALKAGTTLHKVLELVRKFRKADTDTPLVLMGYYNPIHAYGTARFAKDAAAAGVDGLITVDLPPEEDEVLRLPARRTGHRHRAAGHADDRRRAPQDHRSMARAAISIMSRSPASPAPRASPKTTCARRSRASKAQPSFPSRSASASRRREQAAAIARFADGAVVGSAIVRRSPRCRRKAGRTRHIVVADVVDFCASLAQSVHAARGGSVLG